MNGPSKAGKNDVWIFTKNGLNNRLLNLKKKAIDDGGYHGHYNCISTPNAQDSKPVRTSKSRALKRHEAFNGHTHKMKFFNNDSKMMLKNDFLFYLNLFVLNYKVAECMERSS